MSVAKILLILLAIGLISVAVWKGVVPNIKRRKLAEGWAEIFKEGNIDITEDHLYTEFKKLPNKDIDTLIDFSTKLKEKKYVPAYKMLKEIDPIIKKTNLSITAMLAAAEKLLSKK